MNSIQFLTEKDVAELTQISLSKLRQDRHKCTGISYSKIGKSVRYSLEDVLSFMNRHKILSQSN